MKQLFAIAAVCMVVLTPSTLGVAVADSSSGGFDSAGLTEWGGKTTEHTADMFSVRSGFEPTDRVVTHGAGYPGFFVGYDTDDEDAFGTLETWIGASDERTLLYHDADDGVVLVAAPGEHIRRTSWAGWKVDGLSTRSYVEYVEVEKRVEIADPVNLETRETVETKYGPSRSMNLLAALKGGDFSVEQGDASGVAFDGDVNATNMSEVKRSIGADASSIPSNADGSGSTIAVLDTGANVGDGSVFGNGTVGSDIRVEHGKNFVTGGELAANESNRTYDAIADGNLHGTYVAARAAGAGGGDADLRSPAYRSDLAVGKVLGDDGSGSISNIVRGLEWACSPAVDADVLSMSLGSPTYSMTLENEISSCLEDGDVSAITVAAGNSRWTWGRANLGSPADADGVIAVGATTTGSPDNISSAYFSNTGEDGGALDSSGGATRGKNVDIGSPGMENRVQMVDSSGETRNYTLSGTSMSTPDVAAAAAVLVDTNPSIAGDHDAVRERLLETASPAKKIGETEIGHGLLNVSNAVADERPDLDQDDARTEQAKARDEANRGLAGRFGTWLRERGVGA
jgi:hypothetical protein